MKKLSVSFRLLLLLCGIFSLSPGYAADNAVILMYHNVDSETPSITSVTPDSFEMHLEYLADNDFTVWPLSQTLDKLKAGEPIPPKTVVITFDDAYVSVYKAAFPLLKAKGWPFTVFVTTQYITDGYDQFMNWAQLREIEASGGEIGNHSHTHAFFSRHRKGESDSQWRHRIMGEINRAQSILVQQLEAPIPAVAYPYGEFSDDVKEVLIEFGYYGLGQHSGAVSPRSDFQAIPRFPMATGFDKLKDFGVKVTSRNLPATIVSPINGMIGLDTDIPALTLRLEAGDYRKEGLNCFATRQGQINVERSGQDNNVVIIRANQPLIPGRTKYTCTSPSKSEKGVFYWFSFLWMKPLADGSWYND